MHKPTQILPLLTNLAPNEVEQQTLQKELQKLKEGLWETFNDTAAIEYVDVILVADHAIYSLGFDTQALIRAYPPAWKWPRVGRI